MKYFKLDKYRVTTKPIGKGCHGTVYRGYDTVKKKTVAIKVTSRLNSAYREVKVMKKYGQSKYLPVLYDFYIKNNKAYIVMEYIRGKKLGGHFNGHGKIYEDKDSIEILIQILKGLHQLHKSEYYHWDTKPENIMMINNKKIRIKIIDFNMAGTIKDKESIQKDIWHAAMMYIYLMHGTVPEEIEKVKFKDPKLKSVILKTFNKNNEDRFHSAKEFIDALAPFV
ncbi:serine/threonine protein kinase [Natronincola peptidivorans]|uniref:Serine/threonine protein kinase n=1 Tax=Natronincola peptidivorans TaxID=426128 RepID=A0A1H9YUM9_9FIRM|nr:protein kinase [Natronincola peptidivorans]SES72782.1 serine/threonine protein kinase [Natronincola peptidivorans]